MRWIGRLAASASGLLLALVAVELGLRLAGLPRFHEVLPRPDQFELRAADAEGAPFYVNKPSSSIDFRYDSDPRGYFGPANSVRHLTNSAGFRGPELAFDKPADVFRIAFLGDSFTFGEGVRFEDVFSEETPRLLRAALEREGERIEGINFGVGGYNVAQSLFVLGRIASRVGPDLVVLTYVLNDVEPELYAVDPVSGAVLRRPRPAALDARSAEAPRPSGAWAVSRLAQFLWRERHGRARSAELEAEYRRLYAPRGPDWRRTRAALDSLAELCEAHDVPLIVMLFPMLTRLDRGHPYLDLYAQVAETARAAGARVLDLFPAFEDRAASELWVHPTDHHPNELAHRLAARQLADFVLEDAELRGRILARVGG